MMLFLLIALLAQPASSVGRIQNKVLEVAGVGSVTYGISVPTDYSPDKPRPLILALHPGGRMPYYGSSFMRGVVLPGLGDLGAIVVAPDTPASSWNDPLADKAVMALIASVQKEFAIDRRRVLVTGFSMGGRGTWFIASRHPDVFTAAIPIAASIRDETADRLATMPTYVIHSRDDQVAPFGPAEQNARALEKLGRVIRFVELRGVGHYEMGSYIDPLKAAGRWVAERWGR